MQIKCTKHENNVKTKKKKSYHLRGRRPHHRCRDLPPPQRGHPSTVHKIKIRQSHPTEEGRKARDHKGSNFELEVNPEKARHVPQNKAGARGEEGV